MNKYLLITISMFAFGLGCTITPPEGGDAAATDGSVSDVAPGDSAATDTTPADTASADGGTCVPSCRAGYVCVSGRCVSACNPPCAADETCTSDGTCAATGEDAGTDSEPTDSETTCTPVCRSGYVCASGTCVSACNPPCAAGGTCTSSGTCMPSGADAGMTVTDSGTVSTGSCTYQVWHVRFNMPGSSLARSIQIGQYGDYTACSVGIVQAGCEIGHDTDIHSGTFSQWECDIRISSTAPHHWFNAAVQLPVPAGGTGPNPTTWLVHRGPDGSGLDVPVPGTPWYTTGTGTISYGALVQSWTDADNGVGGANASPVGYP